MAAYESIDTNDTSVRSFNCANFADLAECVLLSDSLACLPTENVLHTFQKPQTMTEALQRQMQNFRDDFFDDWVPQCPAFFPCCAPRSSREQKQLETAQQTLQISSFSELATIGMAAGALKKALDSDKPNPIAFSLPPVDGHAGQETKNRWRSMLAKQTEFDGNSPVSQNNVVSASPRRSLTAPERPTHAHMNGSPRSSVSSANHLGLDGSDVPDLLY